MPLGNPKKMQPDHPHMERPHHLHRIKYSISINASQTPPSKEMRSHASVAYVTETTFFSDYLDMARLHTLLCACLPSPTPKHS